MHFKKLVHDLKENNTSKTRKNLDWVQTEKIIKFFFFTIDKKKYEKNFFHFYFLYSIDKKNSETKFFISKSDLYQNFFF